MNKSNFSSRVSKLALTLIVLETQLTACSSQPYLHDRDSSTVVAEILDQINGALAQAKSKYPDAPEVTSVQVDLQVGTTANTSLGSPIGLIFPTVGTSQAVTHKISLTFANTQVPNASTSVPPKAALVTAIEEIYKSVAMANSRFQFQSGSVQLQCTLADNAGVATGKGGGNAGGGGNGSGGSASSSSGSVQLVPIQFDASSSKQAVHTVTLNFAAKLQPAP